MKPAFYPKDRLKLVRGFTMIELAVTLTVLAVLVVIGAPSLTQLIRDSRLTTQADLLVSSLNAARIEAIKQRKNMAVCASTSPNDTTPSCSGSSADWNSGWLIYDSGGSVVVQRTQAKSGVVVTTSSDRVTFNATLGSASAAVTFDVCVAGSKKQQVSVALSGHVSKTITTDVCS